MKLTVKVGDLAGVLKLVAPVADTSSTLPILGNVKLEAVGDGAGRLWVTATDLNHAMRWSCAAKVAEPGAITLPAKRLLNYVKALPDAAEIEAKDGNNFWLNMSCVRAKARIAGLSPLQFPELPEMPDAFATIPVGAMDQACKLTEFAVSEEESRFTLGGALAVPHANTGKLEMVATDGHRMAWTEAKSLVVEAERPPAKIVIPKQALRTIRKMAESCKEEDLLLLAEDENNLFFEACGMRLSARKLAANFPDCKRVLPKQAKHEIAVSRADLLAMLQRVSQFAGDGVPKVLISVKAGQLELRAADAQIGDSEESLVVECPTLEAADGPIEVAFNAKYLQEALGHLECDQVVLKLNGASDAGEMNPVNAGVEWRYVVMPLRV